MGLSYSFEIISVNFKVNLQNLGTICPEPFLWSQTEKERCVNLTASESSESWWQEQHLA